MTGTQTKQRVKAQAVYKPLPWQVTPWRDKASTLLLAGAAGGGKTRFALEKVHGYCLHFPGSTGLLLRKTRESMNNSTVMFLDRVVIGHDASVRHLKAEHRFEYTNGSILAYGGMKDDEQREQIRGIGQDGGVDIAFMEEGVKFSENDFNEVNGRMRGKAGNFRQVIVATNPGPPGHWINQRLILGGEASTYLSRPEDNPYNPPEYIDTLKRLTGILRQRLYEGKWVQAEGLVYQEFDLDNIVDDEPEPGVPIEIAYDDGYIDPRAILFIQRTPSKILVFDELYHSRHLAETCADEIVLRCKALGFGLPEIAVGSPEAKEFQGHLRRVNIPSRARPHEVVQGIQALRELICDGNGYRTLKVNRRCKNLIREITEGYQYPEEGTRRDSEKPLDGNDHACDALRYWCFVRGKP
jgi:phage terminase large subunit